MVRGLANKTNKFERHSHDKQTKGLPKHHRKHTRFERKAAKRAEAISVSLVHELATHRIDGVNFAYARSKAARTLHSCIVKHNNYCSRIHLLKIKHGGSQK